MYFLVLEESNVWKIIYKNLFSCINCSRCILLFVGLICEYFNEFL